MRTPFPDIAAEYSHVLALHHHQSSPALPKPHSPPQTSGILSRSHHFLLRSHTAVDFKGQTRPPTITTAPTNTRRLHHCASRSCQVSPSHPALEPSASARSLDGLETRRATNQSSGPSTQDDPFHDQVQTDSGHPSSRCSSRRSSIYTFDPSSPLITRRHVPRQQTYAPAVIGNNSRIEHSISRLSIEPTPLVMPPAAMADDRKQDNIVTQPQCCRCETKSNLLCVLVATNSNQPPEQQRLTDNDSPLELIHSPDIVSDLTRTRPLHAAEDLIPFDSLISEDSPRHLLEQHDQEHIDQRPFQSISPAPELSADDDQTMWREDSKTEFKSDNSTAMTQGQLTTPASAVNDNDVQSPPQQTQTQTYSAYFFCEHHADRTWLGPSRAHPILGNNETAGMSTDDWGQLVSAYRSFLSSREAESNSPPVALSSPVLV